MSVNLALAAEQLRRHPWVADARCGRTAQHTGLVVALAENGVIALRRHGRYSVLQQLQQDSACTDDTVRWRLLSALPPTTEQAQIDAWLAEPRPRLAALLEQHGDQHSRILQLHVPLDLVHFDGHFPNAPIVPGVVQIDWAVQFAAELFGTPTQAGVLHGLKFQQLLRPDENCQLSLRHEAARHSLHFAFSAGPLRYSSGRISWSDGT